MLRILFAISIIALLMLLWASVAIAHHIRQARRRRRAAAKGVSEVALLYGEVDAEDEFTGLRSNVPPPPSIPAKKPCAGPGHTSTRTSAT